jgi:bifunctional DNA-binding transcriptional regulator/antitoxin component of YhaV-PrlF toxin-antitoxin module
MHKAVAYVRVDGKGRGVIPKNVREMLSVASGTLLRLTVEVAK